MTLPFGQSPTKDSSSEGAIYSNEEGRFFISRRE
jgi:hypothetical protein